MPEAAAPDTADNAARTVIKKYANRRLYNTRSSSYVTLEHLSDMVKAGTDFVVYDAKTNEDITRSVLTQIIFEQEGRSGQNLLPVAFLRQLIRFYGDSLQAFVPGYLELSLDSFSRQQERLREQFGGAFVSPMGGGVFDEQIRQNMALFDQTMKMFSPFSFTAAATAASAPDKPAEPAPAPARSDGELAELKAQLAAMQAQIAKLADKA